MSFTPIKNIITKKFGKSAMAKSVTAALVCEEFDKLILELWGKKMKDQAQAMYLKNKVLTVACLSPVVAQEIKIREREILEALGSKLGSGLVERLRLLT